MRLDSGHYICKHEQMHLRMKCNVVKKYYSVTIVEHIDSNYENNNLGCICIKDN
jgi:hypothetical protein